MFNFTSQNTSLIRFLSFYLFQLVFSYLIFLDKRSFDEIIKWKMNYLLGKLCLLSFISSFSIFFVIKNILIYNLPLQNLKILDFYLISHIVYSYSGNIHKLIFFQFLLV